MSARHPPAAVPCDRRCRGRHGSRRPRRIGGALLALWAGAAWANGEPARLAVHVAPGPHTVGDRVEVVLELTVPDVGRSAGEPRFPSWAGDEGRPATWGEAEVIASGPVERTDGPGGAVYRQRLEIAAFAPGTTALPRVAVAVPGEAGAVDVLTPADLAVQVDSVLPEVAEGAEPPAPMPPSPPRPLDLGARFWWTLAVGGAMAAAAIAWAVVRERRRAAGEARPAPPPFDELLRTLAGLAEGAEPVAGHARLSLALRRYLGRALSFPAPESSTTEVYRELAARPLPPGTAPRAIDLLRACDLVKFARRPADPAALSERKARALELAREVEESLRPPEAPEAGEAAA